MFTLGTNQFDLHPKEALSTEKCALGQGAVCQRKKNHLDLADKSYFILPVVLSPSVVTYNQISTKLACMLCDFSSEKMTKPDSPANVSFSRSDKVQHVSENCNIYKILTNFISQGKEIAPEMFLVNNSCYCHSYDSQARNFKSIFLWWAWVPAWIKDKINLTYDFFIDHDNLSHTIIISWLCQWNAFLILFASSIFTWYGKLDCIPGESSLNSSLVICKHF